MDNLILSGILRGMLLCFVILSLIAYVICGFSHQNHKKLFAIPMLCVCLLYLMFSFGTVRKAPFNADKIEDQIYCIVKQTQLVAEKTPLYFSKNETSCYIIVEDENNSFASNIITYNDKKHYIYKENEDFTCLISPMKSIREAESFFSHQYYEGELIIVSNNKTIKVIYNTNGKYDHIVGFVGSFFPNVVIDFEDLLNYPIDLNDT